MHAWHKSGNRVERWVNSNTLESAHWYIAAEPYVLNEQHFRLDLGLGLGLILEQ